MEKIGNKFINSYTAGFVDGEGYITFRKAGNYYVLWVSVAQTNLEVLNMLKDNYGGSIQKRKVISGCKQAWDWRITGITAYKFLNDVSEYLIVKKDICELVLEAYLYSSTNTTNKKDVQEYYYNKCRKVIH